MMKKCKKILLCLLAMVLGAALLQGCGSKSPEQILAEMSEFTSADGTVSIYLNKNWQTQDMGVDFWLCAGNAVGNQVCTVMQAPKSGMNQLTDSMEGMIALVDESYGVEGETAEVMEVPLLTNVSAVEGTISADSTKVDAYILYGETDYAYYALLFAADNMSGGFKDSIRVSCSKFGENAPEIVDNATVEMTDTLRWFTATFAVLTDLNGWDYNLYAGLPVNDENAASEQDMLVDWWGVTDRATADETLNWIIEEGHRADFGTDMLALEESGLSEVAPEERESFLLDNFEMDEDMAKLYTEMYAMYEEFGIGAIDGWDYCRAMNLLSYYFLAGYYTEQEALDMSLELATAIQPLFGSWDELIESYMRGYEYWAEESADERRAIYEDIKTRADSPYAVDFKLTLEKTW